MNSQSYLSPKCTIKNSLIHGMGLHAREVIYKGEVVAVLGGDVITGKDAANLPSEVFANLVQIHDDLYIGSLTLAPYGLNHSCYPNIGVKGQNLFIARRTIFPDEEICFDYETTETPDEGWHIFCQCGSIECRHYIDGNAWRSTDFQKRNEGYFSWYLQEKITQATKE